MRAAKSTKSNVPKFKPKTRSRRTTINHQKDAALIPTKVKTSETVIGQPTQLLRSQVAPLIKQLLCASPSWAMQCALMRYPPRFWEKHTEVRLPSLERSRRLRLDLVAIFRWTLKRPKEVFGVEIKSCLADFTSDNKWSDYVYYCDGSAKKVMMRCRNAQNTK